MKEIKVSINIYSNTQTEQVKLLMKIFAEIIPLLLKPKKKYIGREGGTFQGKHSRKEEAYWTVERE